MPKRIKHRDENETAASILRQATGQEAPVEPTKAEISAVMAALGRRGGPKGGAARAAALTPARLSEIAKTAAQVRWGKRRRAKRKTG